LGFLVTVVELVTVVVGGGCNVDEFRVSVDAGYDLRGVGDVRNWRLVVSDVDETGVFGFGVLVLDAGREPREADDLPVGFRILVESGRLVG